MDFSTFDLGKMKNMARKGIDKARQIAEGLNELEMKVEEATNNDKWGPHGSLMSEITKRSYHGEEYKQILGILARRLHSEPNHWRHVYKSLLLLEYMAKNGPQKIVPELKSNAKVFTKLQRFEYIDSQGKDQGLNVRNRAKQLWDLVHDDDMIARERETAAKNRNKYSGYDRDTAAFAGRSSLSGTSSRPSTPTADAFTTTPKTKTADTPPDTPAAADAVAATEARISKLAVADDSPDGADGAAAGAALPPRARQKKKLSQMSADRSIAGSIAAMAQKLPVPAGAAGSGPASSAGADDTGLNLLDFGDDSDGGAAPAGQAAAANGAAAGGAMDPLAMLDEFDAPSAPAAPPPAAAAAAAGGDDWAPFADAGGGGAAAAGDDDWAAFVSSNNAAPAAAPAAAVGDWDAFAEPGAGAGGGASMAAPFADPFAAALPAAVPERPEPAVTGAAGARAPLPMDAFMAPAVAPIPVGVSAAMSASPVGSKPSGTTIAGKPVMPEKDPFADLLG